MNDRLRGIRIGRPSVTPGAAVEFQPPGSFKPVVDYHAGGRTSPGEWTDDTSMALCWPRALQQTPADLNDEACRYAESWWSR